MLVALLAHALLTEDEKLVVFHDMFRHSVRLLTNQNALKINS
jgi:hypothetical protein